MSLAMFNEYSHTSDPTTSDAHLHGAWLRGMAAKKREDVVLVGARGLNPAHTKCRIVVRSQMLATLSA